MKTLNTSLAAARQGCRGNSVMRHIAVLFLTIIFLFTAAVSVSGANESNINSVYKIRDSVLSYFYPVSGTVLSVEKSVVRVKFQTDKKLNEGMRLSVLREGRPFYHPVTKELVSKSELFAGKLEIQGYDKGVYLCRAVKGAPEAGDIVRITSSKVKLAFFQHKQTDWTVSEVFYNSLRESGRFALIDAYSKTFDPKEISEIAKGLGADAALMLSSSSKEGSVFLDVKLIWTEDARVFAQLQEPIGADLLKALKAEEGLLTVATPKGEPWGRHELPSGRFIAMGDVDGNGKRELVVSDGATIKIYEYQEEPKEIWSVKGSPQEEHVSLDVLDVNNNGKAEIFVTSMRGEDTVSSYVLEYSPEEGYRKILDKLPYFFRVMGKTLLMQEFSRNEQFSGDVYEAVWQSGKYQKSKALKILPDGVNIYGFTFIDWNDKGQPQVLAFDDKGYLNLYKDRVLIWSSKESYGESDISFKRETHSLINPQEKWFVKGRLITIKTQRGQEALIVKKSPFLAKVPGLGYKSADIYSVWWDGGMMDENLILQDVRGTVTDYWLEGKTLLLIVRPGLMGLLSNTLTGEFSRKSILYYYQFEK